MARAKTSTAGLLRIGEAARMAGVSPETLRLWERHGLLHAQRTASGYRLFSIAEVRRVIAMRGLRAQGINLAGITSLMPRRKSSAADPITAPARPRHFGRTLRQLRISGGLSLAAAGERAGLSASFISQVERDAVSPSLDSLKALCRGLGVSPASLLGAAPQPENPTFVPASRRTVMPSMDAGVHIARLAGSENGGVDTRLFVMAPGKTSGGAYAHDGAELIYVLKGKIRITVDLLDTYTLGPGDSLYLESSRPHEWSVIGDTTLEALWVDMPAQPAPTAEKRRTTSTINA